MNRALAILLGGAVAVILAIAGSSFVLDQASTALVLQFGELKRVDTEPGLKFKWPWQSLVFFDRRLINLIPPSQPVTFSDQTRLDVDAYAEYRITDPLLFYQAVNNQTGARARLSSIVNSSVRTVLGSTKLASLLTSEREPIMAEIQRQVHDAAATLGVEMVDVRIRKADFPEATSAAIFNRMRSERERDAKQNRAEGQKEAQIIRSTAERERTIMIAEAKRDAETIEGEGEGAATRTYADAYGQDPQFFALYRSLQAYQDAFGAGDTPIVLGPGNEFLRYFNSPGGEIRTPRAARPAG